MCPYPTDTGTDTQPAAAGRHTHTHTHTQARMHARTHTHTHTHTKQHGRLHRNQSSYMSLAASLAVGLCQLHILVCPCLTQPLNLLLSVLQLHSMPLHGSVLLLQHLDGLLGFLGLPLLLCQRRLDLHSILFLFATGLAMSLLWQPGQITLCTCWCFARQRPIRRLFSPFRFLTSLQV